MTWWQIYFIAKVSCSSPLISLFLFFLSVIFQEANKTECFQWQADTMKRYQFKNKNTTASQRSFRCWQYKFQKCLKTYHSLSNEGWGNVNNDFPCFWYLKSVPLVFFLIAYNLITGQIVSIAIHLWIDKWKNFAWTKTSIVFVCDICMECLKDMG